MRALKHQNNQNELKQIDEEKISQQSNHSVNFLALDL